MGRDGADSLGVLCDTVRLGRKGESVKKDTCGQSILGQRTIGSAARPAGIRQTPEGLSAVSELLFILEEDHQANLELNRASK